MANIVDAVVFAFLAFLVPFICGFAVLKAYGSSFFKDDTCEQTISRLKNDLNTCTLHLENELRIAQNRDTEQARYTKQLSDGVEKLAETNASANGDKIFWRNISVTLLAMFFIALTHILYTKLQYNTRNLINGQPVIDLMTLSLETHDKSGCLSPTPNYSIDNGNIMARVKTANDTLEENRMLKIELAQTREMLAQAGEAMAKKDLENERNHRQLSTEIHELEVNSLKSEIEELKERLRAYKGDQSVEVSQTTPVVDPLESQPVTVEACQPRMETMKLRECQKDVK